MGAASDFPTGVLGCNAGERMKAGLDLDDPALRNFSPMKNDELILDQYISSFERLDSLLDIETLGPVAEELFTGERTEYGWKRWRPIKVHSELSTLDPIYAKLPARFPTVYEKLGLSYRWASVDLQTYRLLANPPGPDLSGLLHEMSVDTVLWNSLLNAG